MIRRTVVGGGDEFGVSQLQVVVCDSTTTRHDVERELAWLLADVLSDVLKPFETCLSRVLDGDDNGFAFALVRLECAFHRGVLVQAGRQCKGVLHC